MQRGLAAIPDRANADLGKWKKLLEDDRLALRGISARVLLGTGLPG